MLHCGYASSTDFADQSVQDKLAALDLGDLAFMQGWRPHWARQWEYPFVYQVLAAHLSPPARVLEPGSAATPLPFWLSALGLSVTGLDLDSSYAAHWGQSVSIPCRRGPTAFRYGDMKDIPFDDGTFDAVYSVSALEHTDDPALCVQEMVRVCRPGGIIVITFDVALHGDHGVTPEQLSGIESSLTDVAPLYPTRNAAPAELVSWGNARRATSPAYKRIPRRIGEIIGAIPPTNDFAIYGFAGRRNATAAASHLEVA